MDSTTLKKGIKADPSPTTEEDKLCLQQTKEELDAKPVTGNPGSEYRIQFKALMFDYKGLHGLAPPHISDLLSFHHITRPPINQ